MRVLVHDIRACAMSDNSPVFFACEPGGGGLSVGIICAGIMTSMRWSVQIPMQLTVRWSWL